MCSTAAYYGGKICFSSALLLSLNVAFSDLMTLNSSSEFDIGGVVIGRNEDDQDTFKDTKPRILLTGRQRSGKTAINRVVFHKMSPNETLFLQSTSKIQKDSINHSSFVRFEVWEFPGL